MAQKRKVSDTIVVTEERQLSAADKKNLEIINAALRKHGASYRLVQQLADKVLKSGMTTGKEVVRALINVLVDVGDYRVGEKLRYDKKTKKVAIKGLMKLHPNAFDGMHDDLKLAFLKNADDTTLGLGTALLVASHISPTEVDFWFEKNIGKDEVWKTVYYNITTGALLFDNFAIAFSDQGPIFGHLYRKLFDNASMNKMRSVLSNNHFLKSSLRTMVSGDYGQMMVKIFTEIGDMMNVDNLEDVADILREVNGWSGIQHRKVNRMIMNNVLPEFFPGVLTFTMIDKRIPDILSQIEDLSVVGYSFRQYLKYMVRTSLSFDEMMQEAYPAATATMFEMRAMLSECESILKASPNYDKHFKATFSLIE